jgi:5-methyltetrahydrofolate--homocysteine methyltransferase
MEKLFDNIAEAVLDGQINEVKVLTEEAVEKNATAKEILNNGLLKGMNEVGILFKQGELFVPEVLISAKAMDTGMQVIKPLIKEGDIQKKGKCLLATVKGDLHDIGKKLVAMMLEGAGYEVIDLGVDSSPEQIIDAVKEHEPDILGMSAMLTTTMANMKDTIEALKENGLSERVKVMVGGAPVSPNFADSVGANYSSDAHSAVELANKLMN